MRLPFVVQPRREPEVVRVGSDDSGILEVKRYGYLTSGEKLFMSQNTQSGEEVQELLKLSKSVSAKHKVGFREAYEAVVSAMGEEGPEDSALVKEVRASYEDDLVRMGTLLAGSSQKETMLAALCMLKFRVDDNITLQEAMEVHEDLLNDLARLYRSEAEKSLAAWEFESDEVGEAAAEEAEKKPQKARTTRSKSTTGSSKEDSLVTQTSA